MASRPFQIGRVGVKPRSARPAVKTGRGATAGTCTASASTPSTSCAAPAAWSTSTRGPTVRRCACSTTTRATTRRATPAASTRRATSSGATSASGEYDRAFARLERETGLARGGDLLELGSAGGFFLEAAPAPRLAPPRGVESRRARVGPRPREQFGHEIFRGRARSTRPGRVASFDVAVGRQRPRAHARPRSPRWRELRGPAAPRGAPAGDVPELRQLDSPRLRSAWAAAPAQAASSASACCAS